MENKYIQTMMDSAKELDVLCRGDILFEDLARVVIETESSDSIKSLSKRLLEISKSKERKIRQAAVSLNENMISMIGFNRMLDICKVADDRKSYEDIESERTIEELLDALYSLVGLKEVKTQVRRLIAYQTIQQMRVRNNLAVNKGTMHLAFIGNPGTGKTTVARIIGHIYKILGLLSKGHFMEVSRTDLIAGYQGQTALKVKSVIERAKGGVLFIDEAYSITENDHSDSYGRECLTELTKALEDYRDDLVVIVAGYTEPMNKFFASNPGLRSRFNNFINFSDYSKDELLLIMDGICKKNDYVLETAAREKIASCIEHEIQNCNEQFANGRYVRNLYETMIVNQAERLFESKDNRLEALKTIIGEDIPDSLH